MLPLTIRRVCPFCRSADVRRSKRRGFFELYLLRLVLLRPFRCMECDRRHYGLVAKRKPAAQRIGQSEPDREQRR
jgi:hypothetical protein